MEALLVANVDEKNVKLIKDIEKFRSEHQSLLSSKHISNITNRLLACILLFTIGHSKNILTNNRYQCDC
uniref:Uncharacterized protein n=1 Tax=Romanomermis culicivorax TaxID=13658 RepID=A0A915HMI9_ROMCU